MNAIESDRSAEDATTTDPSLESWLYRSEGFAEDLDDLVPALPTPVAALAGRARAGKPALRWASAWGGGWLTRPLSLR